MPDTVGHRFDRSIECGARGGDAEFRYPKLRYACGTDYPQTGYKKGEMYQWANCKLSWIQRVNR